MRALFFFFLLLFGTSCLAQEDALVSFDIEIVNQIDAFGLEQQLLVGKIRNDSDSAYTNISVYADLLNEDGEVIGEAFGYVVDECGEAVLDFPLQPRQERPFLASVELFEEEDVADFELLA